MPNEYFCLDQQKVDLLWPCKQLLNLGNLLIFRKEAELLAEWNKVPIASIHFVMDVTLPSYVKQIFTTSNIHITLAKKSSIDRYVWPPKHPSMEKWTYGSFKRIEMLFEQTNIFPSLNWNSTTSKIARSIYAQKSHSHVIAVHLKNQTNNPMESNANMHAWHRLFMTYRNVGFILLGEDPIPGVILSLPNITKIDQQHYPLSVQLALCSCCDAFMGMTSGLANAAILSQISYVLFKNPLHHVQEMQEELGDRNSFIFAHPKQKLYRQLDNYENLTAALEFLL